MYLFNFKTCTSGFYLKKMLLRTNVKFFSYVTGFKIVSKVSINFVFSL